MSTTTETDTTGEIFTTTIAVTVMAWIAAFVLAVVWWRDLGVERFEEFVARTMLVGMGAFGLSLSAIVAALSKRP